MRFKKKVVVPDPPLPTNVITAKKLMDVIKGRIGDPFVELSGHTYARWDRITVDGKFAVFSYMGIDLLSIPLDNSFDQTLVLMGQGMIEVTT